MLSFLLTRKNDLPSPLCEQDVGEPPLWRYFQEIRDLARYVEDYVPPIPDPEQEEQQSTEDIVFHSEFHTKCNRIICHNRFERQGQRRAC